MANLPPDFIPIKRGNTLDSVKSYQERYSTTHTSSPEQSPSWQTQSTLTSAGSTSNASSSPPGPVTPPTKTERSRNRYGDLGRVPLHRRGTSKTYERLEDLLREAGYKETRVFTPETERLEAAADGDRKGDDNRLTSMGAVVDFLANLFPTSGRHSRQQSNDGTKEYSPSRSAHSPVTPSHLESSIDSFEELTPRASRQIPEARPHRSYGASDLSSRPSESSLHRLQQAPVLVHPRPSRASAYLRHMASTASVAPSRPSSTPAMARSRLSIRTQDKDLDDPSVIFSRKGNGEGEEDHWGQPPLPNTWLETVARAVLASGSGTIGRPLQDRSPRKQQVLRTTRSSLSQSSANKRANSKRRSGLTDQTNTLAVPPLLVMLERGRAGRSESEVTRTKVVCRSAPGSRANSPLRRGSEKRVNERGRGDKRRKARDAEKDRLPSLARTQTEGDPWNHGRGRPSGEMWMTANEVKNSYLKGASSSMLNDDDNAPDDMGTSEDDDEGELDLARMLVHPKRQQSIRSLRKHLHQEVGKDAYSHLGPRTGRGPSFSGHHYVKSPLSEDDDLGQEWGSGWVRRGGGSTGEDDDDAASFALTFGDLSKTSNQTRRPSNRVGLSRS